MDDFFLNWRVKYPPYPHQKQEFLIYRDSPARALLWQQRTGKTKACIDTACYLIETGKIDAVFVLAPNLVHYNWNERELPAHCWEGIDFEKFLWVSSKPFNGLKEAIKTDKPIWFSMNSEALILDRALKQIKMLVKYRKALLIVDESHNYRTPGSKRTRRIRGLKKHFPYKRILTGTSIENSPLAAFSQFEILEDEALGCKTYQEFKDIYAVMEPKNYGRGVSLEVTGYKNLDLLTEKLSKWSSVVGREGIPPFTHTYKDFELTKKQREMYEKFKKDCYLDIQNEMISTESLAVKGLKLQQIISGFIIDSSDGGKKVIDLVPDIENPRLLTLLDTIESTDGKIIIWCQFKEDIKKICRMLIRKRIKFVEYHGGVKKDVRNKAIDFFMNGDCEIFLGQPQAGGTGLTLSAAGTVIWYTHTYDAIVRAQASERATKYGGESVSLIDICAINSIDQRFIEARLRKASIVEIIMEEITN